MDMVLGGSGYVGGSRSCVLQVDLVNGPWWWRQRRIRGQWQRISWETTERGDRRI
jgi:hypothetical protein